MSPTLSGLLELKLEARRQQDLADIVDLLEPLGESEYLRVEAMLPGELRRDAIEELELDARRR